MTDVAVDGLLQSFVAPRYVYEFHADSSRRLLLAPGGRRRCTPPYSSCYAGDRSFRVGCSSFAAGGRCSLVTCESPSPANNEPTSAFRQGTSSRDLRRFGRDVQGPARIYGESGDKPRRRRALRGVALEARQRFAPVSAAHGQHGRARPWRPLPRPLRPRHQSLPQHLGLPLLLQHVAEELGEVIELHGIADNAAPPNKSMELTIKSVTPFACAKTAPLLLAAHARC